MDQSEINEILKQNLLELGVPEESATQILQQNINAASAFSPSSEDLQKATNASPSSGEVQQQSKEALAAGQDWKKTFIANLEAYMETESNITNIQEGKTGIMFKTKDGNYYSVKVTLHKKMPADFQE